MHPLPFPINTISPTPTLQSTPSSLETLLLSTSLHNSSSMARLTGIIALLVVAVLVADAYAYHTTVTTVEVDEDNQRHMQRCQQMKAHEMLRSCEQYMRQMMRRDVLQMRGGSFDECCRELRNMDEMCRCDLLEEMVMEQMRQARGQEGMQMMQKAKNLPSMCGLRPQRCEF